MRELMKPVFVQGILGWSNRKGGFEAYGPGGRWTPGPDGKPGFLLGDALEEAGAHEGCSILTIAVDSFAVSELYFHVVQEFAERVDVVDSRGPR